MPKAPAHPEVDAHAAALVQAQWLQALTAYRAWLVAEGRAPESTNSQRLRILNTFASSVGRNPWTVSDAHVTAWLDARQLAASTRRSYAKQLRAFYRWAHAAGHTSAQLVSEARPVAARTASPAWETALRSWRLAEDARGVATATTATRSKHVRRFAAECDTANPWNVTAPQVAQWLDRHEWTAHTRAVARAGLQSFYRWARTAKHVADDPAAAPSQRAVLALAAEPWEQQLSAWARYMRSEGKPSTTVSLRLSHVRRFARQHEHLTPFAVTGDDLTDWIASKRWAPETARSVRASLRAFYHWAKLTRRASRNPAKRLPKVRTVAGIARPATDADYREALAKGSPADRLALRLAAQLGLRRSEVAQVHTSDLARTADGLTLTVHGKGRRVRVLPVPEPLATSLRALPAGYAFPGREHGHVSAAYLGKRLSSLLPPGVTMHMLRHRFATTVYDVDRDILTVQRLLGHASPATTQRYVAVTTDRMRALVEAAAS